MGSQFREHSRVHESEQNIVVQIIEMRGDSLRVGYPQGVQYRGTFTPVAREHEDLEIRISRSYAGQFIAGPVGAAVNDHPDRVSLLSDRRDGLEQSSAGVVAWDEHDIVGQGVYWTGDIHMAPGRVTDFFGNSRAMRAKKVFTWKMPLNSSNRVRMGDRPNTSPESNDSIAS